LLNRFGIEAVLALAETDDRNCIASHEFIHSLPINSKHFCYLVSD